MSVLGCTLLHTAALRWLQLGGDWFKCSRGAALTNVEGISLSISIISLKLLNISDLFFQNFQRIRSDVFIFHNDPVGHVTHGDAWLVKKRNVFRLDI